MVVTLWVAILTAVLLQEKTSVLYPRHYDQRSASLGSTDVFQGFGKKVLALQICLYWAAVPVPTLIALEHLMPVSSMWPIGPLVLITKAFDLITVNLFNKNNKMLYRAFSRQAKQLTLNIPVWRVCRGRIARLKNMRKVDKLKRMNYRF